MEQIVAVLKQEGWAPVAGMIRHVSWEQIWKKQNLGLGLDQVRQLPRVGKGACD